MVPLRAVVAVPELQLSTSWVDFGTCFVNQDQVREVYLMNLSSCRSYWAVLTGESCLPLAPCSPVLQACVPLSLQGGSPGPGPPGHLCTAGQFPNPTGKTSSAQPRCWVGVRSLCCVSLPLCRSAGARQGPCGLQGLPKQWAAGGTTGQRTPNLHHPPGFLHCQVQPLTISLALPCGTQSPGPGPLPHLNPRSPQEL